MTRDTHPIIAARASTHVKCVTHENCGTMSLCPQHWVFLRIVRFLLKKINNSPTIPHRSYGNARYFSFATRVLAIRASVNETMDLNECGLLVKYACRRCTDRQYSRTGEFRDEKWFIRKSPPSAAQFFWSSRSWIAVVNILDDYMNWFLLIRNAIYDRETIRHEPTIESRRELFKMQTLLEIDEKTIMIQNHYYVDWREGARSSLWIFLSPRRDLLGSTFRPACSTAWVNDIDLAFEILSSKLYFTV